MFGTKMKCSTQKPNLLFSHDKLRIVVVQILNSTNTEQHKKDWAWQVNDF